MKMSIVLIVILVALVLVVYFYNGLVTANNKVKDAWVDLENLLKQRYGLVSKIIESKKNTPEAENLIQLQSKAMQSTSLQDKSETEKLMSQELEKIDGEFSQELKALEDQIQTSRRFYNGTVRDLNLKLMTIPNNFIAEKLGFLKAELFATQEEIKNELVKTPETEPTPAPEPVTPEPEPEPTQAEQAPTPEPMPKPEETIAPEQESTPSVPETTPVPEPEPAPLTPEQTQTPEPAQAQPGQPQAQPEQPQSPQQ